MKHFSLFSFLALLCFAFVQAQPKIEKSVLKHAIHCNKRVSPKSTIQIQFSKRDLESDNVIENSILQIAPGQESILQDLGLEKEVFGMCVGEIRRFVIPKLNAFTAYDIEVLDADNPRFFTPLFWTVLGGIGVTYIIVSIMAKRVDDAKNQDYLKNKK